MSEHTIRSDLNAKVWAIEVTLGAHVDVDDVLIVLESMKTEIPIVAPAAGIVASILVASGDLVSEGQVLITLR